MTYGFSIYKVLPISTSFRYIHPLVPALLGNISYYNSCHLNVFSSITPQTVMLGGIPPSIRIMAEHGKWRVMACQLAAWCWFSVISITYNDQHCDCTSVGEMRSRRLHRRARYLSRIFHRDARCKSTRDAGWKYFPPSTKPFFCALKPQWFFHSKGRGFVIHLFMDFSQYLLTMK